jgi:hypothetical protein
MKIDKFEKFFESNKRNLTIEDLEDLLVDIQDLLEKDSVFIKAALKNKNEKRVNLFDGIDEANYEEVGYKGFGFIVNIRLPYPIESFVKKSEILLNLWSEINSFIKRLDSGFNVIEIKDAYDDSSHYITNILIITTVTDYVILWTSNYFLESLILNYNSRANILNKNEGNQFSVSIKKEDVHQSYSGDKTGIEELTNDYIDDLWGEKNVEYELIETEDSYVFKNFKIKNLFK